MIKMTPTYPYSAGNVEHARDVEDPEQERRRCDGDRHPFPDAPEEPGEREPEADEQHGDEHAEPHEHVESLVGQGQHVGAQEQAPRDPEGDPGQEGEADVAEIVTETVGAIRRLEGRIAEPQPQPIQA